MDKQSELLVRSALHDLANVLAGVQGILELSDPERPLTQRDRDRLEAVVAEGVATLGRARHLAMGTLPESCLEEGPDWRAQLEDELRPMGVLFRCRFELRDQGGPGPDRWAAPIRSYLRAAIRQALPYIKEGVMVILMAREAAAWTLHLGPLGLIPEGLLALPADKPGDICGRWAQALGTSLGLALSCEDGFLLMRIPRP